MDSRVGHWAGRRSDRRPLSITPWPGPVVCHGRANRLTAPVAVSPRPQVDVAPACFCPQVLAPQPLAVPAVPPTQAMVAPQWDDWAGHAVDAFSSQLAHLADRQVSVAYGSDCSGAEAPVFALRAIADKMQCSLGATVEIKHEFAQGP